MASSLALFALSHISTAPSPASPLTSCLAGTAGAVSRSLSKRLLPEYQDLARSLPLARASSVFLRSQESRFNVSQVSRPVRELTFKIMITITVVNISFHPENIFESSISDFLPCVCENKMRQIAIISRLIICALLCDPLV